MSKTSWIILFIFGFFFLLIFAIAGVCITSYVSANNTAAQYEANIKAQYNNAKQTLGGYSSKLREAGQIPQMQADDLVKVITGANSSRYGASGNGATFLMLKEQNPSLDQATYSRLMTIIESGSDDWKNLQTKILDKCASYETLRNQVWSGFWIRIAGYPKDVNLAVYCKPISSDYADSSYASGKSEAIKLR